MEVGEYELGFQILFEARRLGAELCMVPGGWQQQYNHGPFNTILVSLIQRLLAFHQNPSILTTQLFETEQL